MEIFDFVTKDGITLSGLLWDKGSKKSVLLLHMMPATKESWQDLAPLLAEQGLNVLAFDFRGHGESEGGDYASFTDEQHQEYYKDVEAAVELLEQRYPGTEVGIAGASIGANEALKYMSEHGGVRRVVALSAGLDYHGVRAADYVTKLKPAQSVLFAAARDDIRQSGMNCAEMSEQLYELATGKKEKLVYDAGGHGTNMLAYHPDLVEKIVSFFAH